MSWMTMLYKTYDNLQKEPPDDLLPISHSTQNAQIEVTINSDGEFVDSKVIDKDDTETIIPVTESSLSKSGKHPVSHPLCDKLQYLAGDYTKYGGEKGDTFYINYIKKLDEWCKSDFINKKVIAIYNYLSKKSLISDLVNNCTLICGDNNILLSKWNGDKKEIPPIFKVLNTNQSDAFVRFRVVDEDSNFSAVWQDKKLQEDYIKYYNSKCNNKKMCVVTGQDTYCAKFHPKGVLKWSYNAKLLCDNLDLDNRFETSDKACPVSYEVSQKAHNALKYLISKQGIRIGDRAFVLWGTRNEKMPCVTDDTIDLLYSDDNSEFLDTKESLAIEFNKAITGYKSQLDNYSELALIGLDAATTGRMGITFYREYKGQQGNELIDRIALWHKTGEWKHFLYSKKAGKRVVFYGTPSLQDIATTAFGTEQGDFIKADGKIISTTVERLITCVCDGAKIPRDIVSLLVKKCFHPQNYSDYNWEQVITITCSMYRKYLYDYENKKEEWSMAIKEDCDDLSYNLGRYLAVADKIESNTFEKGKEHQTNALKYYTRFTQFPNETLLLIEKKLIPYINKLGNEAKWLLKIKQDILTQISPSDLGSVKKVDGKFVLGFDSQRQSFYQKKTENNKEE